MKTADAGGLVPPRSHLSLSLLGPFRARVGHGPVTGLRTRKQKALLAYLTVETDREHRRDALAELFWPERPEGVARASLRQALSDLRRAIGGKHLLTTRHTAQFNTASDHWLDLTIYRTHLEATRHHPHDNPDTCPVCMGRLQQAVALYRGEFLADLELDDSREFQEWVTVLRERLSRQQGGALQRLTLYRQGLGDLARARRYARQWVELDPWSERAHRLRMEVLALGGQRRAALEQYETCRRMLAEELGLKPGPETVALYEQIRDGMIRPMADRPPAQALQNLPAHLTPFVGRQRELDLVDQLLSKPDCRLLTVVGPGGVGKTRLALRAAERIYGADTFAEGVWFVPLENIPSPSLLTATVAEVLGLALKSQQTPEAQLLDHLRPRTMLLVLDNLEHMLHPNPLPERQGTDPAGQGEEGPDEAECADLLLEILREAPGIKILVTSRERLNCKAEFLLALKGLPHPQDLTGLGDPAASSGQALSGLDYPAPQLFLERAGRAQAGFAATEETAPAIVRICQLVEGLPLGIELAAASLGPGAGARSCEQIAGAIHEGLDALAAPLRDLPRRQRSIHAVFEHSWQLLSEVERDIYRRLSVFRGGFDLQAARTVVWQAEDDKGGRSGRASYARLPLQGLADRSLLRLEAAEQGDGATRYSLHPLLRQCAAEKLAENPGEEAATRERHGRFYLAFLEAREEAITGPQAEEGLDQIQGEIANVRAAWAWGVAQNAIDALHQSVSTLAHFYNCRGLFQEGEAAFRRTAEHLFGASPIPESPVSVRLLACLRLEQARFLFGLGEYARIPKYAKAAITLAKACHDPTLQAEAELIRGHVHHNLGELLQAQGCYERALSQSTAGSSGGQPPVPRDRLEVEARSLNDLAMVAKRQGRLHEAERYLERSLRAAREADDLAGQCRALNGLGMVLSRRGDYAQALLHSREALEAARACGDRRLEGSLLNNQGNMHLRLGFYDEAGAHYERALEIQQEISARQKEIPAWFNLGLVHHYLGDEEIAQSRFQQALRIAEALGDPRSQGFAWMGMGHALLGLRHLDEARDAYQKAVTLRLGLGQAHLTAEPLAGLARVCLAQGDPGQAQSHVEEILLYLGSGGTLEGLLSPFQVYLTCHHVLEANQDSRAATVLETAHDLLQAQAAKITDQKLRHSFLKNVAAHRELVQAFGRRSRKQGSPAKG
jgi:predicted ATPase/DNA-binding SARP family transcriptional activator/Tfp pilus assembly protein PilF